MKIANDERETITVVLDYKPGRRHLRPFYCVKCGKMLCETTGDARTVAPGSPMEDGSLEPTQAYRCGGNVHVGGGDFLKCTATYYFC